jgi:hypothetical protein
MPTFAPVILSASEKRSLLPARRLKATPCQYFELDKSLINAAAERNPDKWDVQLKECSRHPAG